MGYKVNIPGFESQNVEVEVSFWTGPKLLVNGKPAPKGKIRSEMILQYPDGRKTVAEWKPQFLGLDVPQLVVEGNVISLVEPLKWYHWVWGGLPIVLVFVGGALGGIAGFTAFAVNSRIFRADLGGFEKFALTGIVSVVAVLVYFIGAMLVTMLLRG